MQLHEVFERCVLKEVRRSCPAQPTGRPRRLDDATALALIFKVLRTGMQWREVQCAASYSTIFRTMHRWCDAGVFTTAYKRVLTLHKRLCPTAYYCVDSTYVKNAFGRTCVGRNHTDRGRKALKLSTLVDHTGVPHGLCCHPGNRPDVVLLQDTLASQLLHLQHLPLYGDRGYDSRRNRSICASYGLQDRILRRKCRSTRRTNSKRIVVEHSFAWMKSFRRLLHFYEHHPQMFAAFAFLAFGHLLSARLPPSDLP